MNLFKQIIGISILVLILSACTSTKAIMVDVRQPAKVNFPEYISSVAVVDNSANYEEIDNQTNEASIINQTKKHYLRALRQFMEGENFFSKVSLDTIPLREDFEIENIHFLAPGKVIRLANRNDVDAIVSVDQFRKVSAPAVLSDYPYEHDLTMNNLQIVCSLYDKNGNKLGVSFSLGSDTIFYWSKQESPFEDRDLTHNSAIRLADNTAKTLLPYWQKQERLIYIDNTKNKKQALASAEQGKWAEAALQWGNDFTEQKNDLIKSRLASNIALANELVGDYSNAMQWLNIALELQEENKDSNLYQNLKWYKDKLGKREKEALVVKLQLEGDND